MGDDNFSYQGRKPRASFVMAFLKGAEISKLLLEGESIRAIARYYDRNPVTVMRAIVLLKEHEAEIARGDVMAVAKAAWKGGPGWEKSPSFLEAKAHIEAGKLIPKSTNPLKRRQRIRQESVTTKATPEQSSMVRPPAPVVGAEEDDVLDSLKLNMPLISQANRAAQRTL